MVSNLFLDFSHIYSEEIDSEEKDFTRIDLSDISGTNMYCSAEACQEIRKRLKNCGPCGIHFLDNGNYHYATIFFIEKIREPFSLVLFDHHTDMQKPMIEGMISCGSWAGEILRKNQYLKQMILIGPEWKSMKEIDVNLRSKLICMSMEEINSGEIRKKIPQINTAVPIYISIDKDVLDPHYARTNWNQGDMSIDVLKELILEVFRHQNVIGVDICGECSFPEPLPQFEEDEEINKKTNLGIYKYLIRLFRFQKKNAV